MSRRYEQVDEYAPGNEDYEYDAWRQRRDDDEDEARAEDALRTAQKRAASGMSPELINLQEKRKAA